MSNTKPYKFLTQEDWQEIRDLLEGGLSISAVRNRTGRGMGTIINVRSSDSFMEYKTISKEKYHIYEQARKNQDLSKTKPTMYGKLGSLSKSGAIQRIGDSKWQLAEGITLDMLSSRQRKSCEELKKEGFLIESPKEHPLQVKEVLKPKITTEETSTPNPTLMEEINNKLDLTIKLLEEIRENTKPKPKKFNFFGRG